MASNPHKPHELHERGYRKLRADGLASWGERGSAADGARCKPIDPDTERFLEDVLAQPWAPTAGRALELGCGSAPMLRWLRARGFEGTGVDVSATALAMAREQSEGLGLQLVQADLCKDLPAGLGRFELVLDGHCFHCVISDEDRAAWLGNVRRLLAPGGLFVLVSMCGPIPRRTFRRCCPGGRLLGEVVYNPFEDARSFEGWREVGGEPHVPTRRIPHWRALLREVRRAGFTTRLHRYSRAWGDDPCGSLGAALS